MLTTIYPDQLLDLQDRDALAAPDRMPGSPKKEADSEGFVFDLLQHSYRAHKPGLGEMRHGTEGWHALETSVLVSSPASFSEQELWVERLSNFPCKLD